MPAIFANKYFKDLTKLKGDQGAKELMLQNLQDLELVENQNNLLDLDSPEDYEDYLKSI